MKPLPLHLKGNFSFSTENLALSRSD
uniref:Uncharacterized protein n=1 Tax=Lepeophtheirus salmonis TaxID=72036 RepID=A0A0K2V3I5_LEPSM